MLNEIYRLTQSLRESGLVVRDAHPWIKAVKKHDGFIICLDSNSQIEDVEYCNFDRMSKMWKIMPDNQNSFPVINLKTPLLTPKIGADELSKLLENRNIQEQLKGLKTVAVNSSLAYPKKELDKFFKRIHWYPHELKNHDGIEILNNLHDRLAKLTSEEFLKNICSAVIKHGLDGRLPCFDLIGILLFGKYNRREKEFEKLEIPVVFDIADYDKFGARVFDAQIKEKVNQILLEASSGNINQDAENTGIDSYTGSIAEVETKFPQPNLPIIGPTYIFSMNQDAPCHYRYGKIGGTIFPVSKDITRKMYNSLITITKPEKRGKTWQSVPNHKKRKDLLIVYMEERPDVAIELASIFSESFTDESAEVAFEEIAGRVCSALNAEPSARPESKINLLVLTQLDPGRKQVVLYSVFTIENIINSANEWQAASKNHPDMEKIPLPGKKGEKAIWAITICPTVASFMQLFQYQWIRNGTDKSDVAGIHLSDIYDIFLSGEASKGKISERILGVGLKYLMPLLSGIGGAIRSGHWDDYKPDVRKNFLTAISALAILLYKIGFKKEDYMEEASFSVGKFLALIDALHKQYCQHVRKGDIPPQLIGNALLPIAADNPEQCFSRALDRIKIYQAWANKVQPKDFRDDEKGFRITKWLLVQLGYVSELLSKMVLPKKMSDADRAQLLLGYLTRLGSNENQESQN